MSEKRTNDKGKNLGQIGSKCSCTRARESELDMGNRSPVGQDGQPERKLTQAGQIRDALLDGDIDLAEIVRVAKDGLSSFRTIWKNGQFIEEPDQVARLKWAEFLTHTIEGLPIKRQEIIHRTVPSSDELIAKAKKSPAFARALADQVGKILEDVHDATPAMDE